jgi:branched-chain amino acid transport system substrate-binding protein
MTRFLILLNIIIVSFTIIAQENEFNEAVNLYKSGKQEEAFKLFNRIVDNYKQNSYTSPSKYFISKILIEQTKYAQAEREINRFLDRNSASRYVADFRLLKIKLYTDQFRYEDAFNECLKLVESLKPSEHIDGAKQLSRDIALNHLSSRQIKNITDETRNKTLKPFLLLILGKKYLLDNDNVNAIRSFNEVISSYSSSVEYTEAERLKSASSTLSSYGDKGILIGVMLPLKDSDGRPNIAGQEILEGIKYAVYEYNQGRQNKIGILVRDTRRSKENVKAIKEEFINNSDVRCILGPIFSDEVRIALDEFRNVDIAMISPTATDEDLTVLSNNFFQANPPFSIRGRIFAQYLYYVENKRKMAVLNAIEGYSPLLATNFMDEFQRIGGSIVVRETYRSNSFSLTEQIKNISARSSDIDGLYIPLADKIDATAILSQLAQNNFSVPIYGNQDWMLVKGFESSPDISNTLTFTSDYFIDFNDSIFKNFTSSFQNITGREINRNILYGYDTAKYLLTAMRNIDPTRKAVRLKMESGLSSVGYKNNISFDETRMNKYLNILRYNDGIFLLVDKFRAGR